MTNLVNFAVRQVYLQRLERLPGKEFPDGFRIHRTVFQEGNVAYV